MKKFAVFDIDGTVFRWQLFHEIVDGLFEAGHIPASARKNIEIELANWHNRSHKTAFRTFELAVVNAFFPALKGLEKSALEAIADKVVERSAHRVYAYTRHLLKKLKADDYTLIAISGSHDEVVKKFGARWDFDIAVGQTHEDENGIYTGNLGSDRLLIEQKDVILQRIVAEHNLDWKDSIAVGDSLSDAKMLAIVAHPIAFNPNEELFEEAKKHGWKVVVERKNMIFELEQRDGVYVLAEAGSR